jgi:signal transduction histidine kinase/CheY-like chemotaxis protein
MAVGVDGAFDLLAQLTARLASTARLGEIVDTVLGEIVDLGFGAAWMARLDEQTGHLITLKEVIDGVDTTHEMPPIFMLDMRQPVGRGFRELRMINIQDPDSLHILENDDDVVPGDQLALPRVIYEHLRGHPFACGPVLGSRGQPVGALGLSSYRGNQPIPDEVLSHGLLRAFRDHLGIAMERAAHVARLEQLNAELVKAQDVIARDARIKAIGELAAAVAHDLNNLCGVGLLALSVGTRSPQAAYDVLPRIERAVRSIGDLVSRLQRVSGHDAEAGSADTARLDEVLDDTFVMIKPVLIEHDIAVTTSIDPVPPVYCDPVLLHQIVLNLVLNAKDALLAVPPERRALRVRVRSDGDTVRLQIADTGPGIAREVIGQLFQPFVTTKGEGHAGLGLAAARASLKHIGAQIDGANAGEGGAVFDVVLRAAARAEPTAHEPLGELSVPRGASILAVDDDPDIVDVVRTFLEPLGFDVATASEADQAIRVATDRAFDMILCDLGLPKRSGLDVCQALRESGYRGKLVLMTGWDMRAVLADKRAGACDRVLKKPFLGTDLLHVVTSLFAT